MDAWFEQIEGVGLPHGTSLDLDFHTVPANAGIPKAEQSDEILRFIEFWKRHTGELPAELIFDSQLTTHENLSKLNQQGIFFITLCRRSRKMLGEIYSRPASAWQRIALDSLTRTFRTPRVLDEYVPLKGYDGLLRQLTVIDLGHEEPTVLPTNNFKIGQAPLITRYAQPKTIFRNLLDLSAKVEVEAGRVVVTIDKRAHNPYLVASGLADQPVAMPWFGNKQLHIRFA